MDKFRIGVCPKFEAALGRLHHRGRAQREDAGLSTFVLGSAFVALDTDRFEVEQDGFITEAEFDAKMLISCLLFSVLDSMIPTLTFAKPIRTA